MKLQETVGLSKLSQAKVSFINKDMIRNIEVLLNPSNIKNLKSSRNEDPHNQIRTI